MFILLERLIIVWNTCSRQQTSPLKIHNMADMGVVFARKCAPQNDRIKSCVTTWNSCVKPQEVPSYGHTSANNDNSRLLLHLHEVGCGNIIRNQRKEHLICTSHLPPFLHKTTPKWASTQWLKNCYENDRIRPQTVQKRPYQNDPKMTQNSTKMTPKWTQRGIKWPRDTRPGWCRRPSWQATLVAHAGQATLAVQDGTGSRCFRRFWHPQLRELLESERLSFKRFLLNLRAEWMYRNEPGPFVLKDPCPNQK